MSVRNSIFISALSRHSERLAAHRAAGEWLAGLPVEDAAPLGDRRAAFSPKTHRFEIGGLSTFAALPIHTAFSFRPDVLDGSRLPEHAAACRAAALDLGAYSLRWSGLVFYKSTSHRFCGYGSYTDELHWPTWAPPPRVPVYPVYITRIEPPSPAPAQTELFALGVAR